MVIETFVLQQVHRAAAGSALGVGRAEDDAVEPAMHHRPGTHRARLLGDEQRAAGEPPVAECLLGGGEREHLGVRGGVVEQFHLVERPGDDPAVMHDHRADRHLLRVPRLHGLAQGLSHEVVVAVKVDDRLVSHGLTPRWSSRRRRHQGSGNARRRSHRGAAGTVAKVVRGRCAAHRAWPYRCCQKNRTGPRGRAAAAWPSAAEPRTEKCTNECCLRSRPR